MLLALAVFVIAGIAGFLAKSLWNYRALPVLQADPGPADVTIIIPARNEAANIARVVASFPGRRIIVVDDNSADGTAARAAEAGAEVLAAGPLPPAWMGKPHACQRGAEAASSKWLLFVDADTWFDPGFAGRLVGAAEAGQLDVATAFLDRVCLRPVEKIVLPYAFALYFTGVSARRVNDPASPEALANGQCLLFRREAYLRLGGHRAVRDSIIEDVALARAAKTAGLKLRVLRAERFGRVRMYDSWSAIVRGFEKNSFRFLRVNPWCGAQVVASSVLLTSIVPLAAALWHAGQAPLALAVLGTPAAMLAPWYRFSLWSLTAPLAVYLFQWIALRGLLATLARRRVLWKGRPV